MEEIERESILSALRDAESVVGGPNGAAARPRAEADDAGVADGAVGDLEKASASEPRWGGLPLVAMLEELRMSSTGRKRRLGFQILTLLTEPVLIYPAKHKTLSLP